MQGLHVFVISWAGQHENAVAIAAAATGASDRVSLVYSDPDPQLRPAAACELIRRPNELFWGDKFKACLDAFGAGAMLVIQGDCRCDDWAGLVRSCHATMNAHRAVGVWAPRVEGTPYPLETTRITRILSTSLSVVAQTDGVVFGLAPAVVLRMKLARYDRNVYGWGIDAMAVAHAFANQMLAVVDESVVVRHPESRGYDEGAARAQWKAFMAQLTPAEQMQSLLLAAQMKLNALTRAGERAA